MEAQGCLLAAGMYCHTQPLHTGWVIKPTLLAGRTPSQSDFKSFTAAVAITYLNLST